MVTQRASSRSSSKGLAVYAALRSLDSRTARLVPPIQFGDAILLKCSESSLDTNFEQVTRILATAMLTAAGAAIRAHWLNHSLLPDEGGLHAWRRS